MRFPIVTQLLTLCIFHKFAEAIYCGLTGRIDDLKYMVAISLTGYGLVCGGAILDERHILTAAHCVELVKKKNLIVVAGTAHASLVHKWGEMRSVKTIHKHPQYYSGINDPSRFTQWMLKKFECVLGPIDLVVQAANDVAVLTLDNPLPFNDRIDKVNLPGPDSLSQCGPCMLAAWGDTGFDEINGAMQWVLFTIWPDEECRSIGVMFRDNEFCASDSRIQACTLGGDSGSPLVCNGAVVGVLSLGICNPDFPSIFTKVYDHYDFIKGALND